MSKNKRYSDEEMLDSLKVFYENHGRRPKMSDFVGKKPSDSMIGKRFGSWRKALELAGIEFGKLNNRVYDKDYLREMLLEYYNKYNKVPTIRGMKSEGYPTVHAYINHFGSFKNALKDVGLFKLRRDVYQFCETYTDEELLNKLRDFMKNRDRIPVGNEYKEIDDFNSGIYVRRFGSIYNAFKLIGYDIDKQKEKDSNDLKEKMLEDYKNLYKMLGKLPTVQDIDCHSVKGMTRSMGSYNFHFGDIFKVRELCGLELGKVERVKTREDLLNDLHNFAKELNRTPTQTEVKYNKNIDSLSHYTDVFGTYRNAVEEAGLEPSRKVYYSKNNEKCFSVYELTFNDVLIDNNILYEKEIYYSSVVKDFNKRYRFDYVIDFNNKKYYIEIFGILYNEKYNERSREKINICKINKIPLITFYPDDFYTTIKGDLYSQLINRINEYETNTNLTYNAQIG